MADVEPAAQPMAVDTPAGGEAGQAAKEAQRFTLKKWNAVAVWSWSICTDTCAICRNTLHEPSIEYQANPTTASEEGLSVAWGDCGHVFHLDCISKWFRTRSNCPLCNKEWEFSKIEKARAARPATAARRSFTPPSRPCGDGRIAGAECEAAAPRRGVARGLSSREGTVKRRPSCRPA